ncbi:MAG: hypothetical protein Fur0046_11860 [Cyanobacteria bacterium J069]|nr:MAG: hypothetical protein D6742_13810 [Cyanobacteria bacterium J069]
MPPDRPSSRKAKPPSPPQDSDPALPELSAERFPVVGIGASAGGLEAFTQLLSHVPLDTGMAFVLVQHLDPSQKSLLSEILARTTRMPVHEAQEGMAIAPNRVYVIPPNVSMTLVQGCLHLTVRERAQKVSKAIDTFFHSLAAERGDRAIAVVLSGGDDDGTRGLEAVKAAGGITFAQSEDSAQVSSMPHMAIASGLVDFILDPEAIAAELANISRHPYVTTAAPSPPKEEPPEQTDAISTIFALLQSSFGVNFTHYKRTTLQRRILRRMALHRLERPDEYTRHLQGNPTEVQALYEEILPGQETGRTAPGQN